MRKGSHTVSRLTYHIVWSTKYRYHILKGDIQKRCRALIIQIFDVEDVKILKGVVSKDHIHIHIEHPPQLAYWTHQLARFWNQALSPCEDTFIVDSIPIPIAHIARQHATNLFRETFVTVPDKGYSAVLGQYYIGYKLHLLVSLDGVYQRMELTKASVRDSQCLKNIKSSGIKNSLL